MGRQAPTGMLGGSGTPVPRPPAPSTLRGNALRGPHRTESRADLLGEEGRLLPGGEMPALVDLVVVDEVGIRLLRPAPRRLVLLARKDGDSDRDRDTFGVEEAAPVL